MKPSICDITVNVYQINNYRFKYVFDVVNNSVTNTRKMREITRPVKGSILKMLVILSVGVMY